MPTTIILTSLLGTVLATATSHGNPDIREPVRTGSTITVNGVVVGQ
jgi:hypothetical protein